MNLIPNTNTNVISHLQELRQRLAYILIIYGIALAALLPWSKFWFHEFAVPLLNNLPATGSLITTSITATFTVPLKLTVILALILTAPLLIYQLWAFITPGLYKSERKFGLKLVALSSFLFYLGMSFAYFIVCPLTLKFFAFLTPAGVKFTPDIATYLNFILNILLAFGICFQIPIISALLINLNILSKSQLRHYRPHVVVAAFTVGMLLTPPDVISQIMLALPIWLLFELGICLPVKLKN